MTKRNVKKAAKKATKKTAKKAVKKVATKRTRASKDGKYLSLKTNKPVTDAYGDRNPSKVYLRVAPAVEPEVAIEPITLGEMSLAQVRDDGGYSFEDPQLDINTALQTGAEDNIFWAVVKKGVFTSRIVQLFTTRERAAMEADQLDRESGLSFNSYVVQRAPLNLDMEREDLGAF